jgi:hypothetical protein
MKTRQGKGSTLVEFPVLFPMFVVLFLFGSVATMWGLELNALNQAARAGLRVAIDENKNESEVRAEVLRVLVPSGYDKAVADVRLTPSGTVVDGNGRSVPTPVMVDVKAWLSLSLVKQFFRYLIDVRVSEYPYKRTDVTVGS